MLIEGQTWTPIDTSEVPAAPRRDPREDETQAVPEWGLSLLATVLPLAPVPCPRSSDDVIAAAACYRAGPTGVPWQGRARGLITHVNLWRRH